MEQINTRNRFWLILIVTALALVLYRAKGIGLGQDLRGGTSLRFSIPVPEGTDATEIRSETMRIIDERVNKFGLGEVTIAPYGENEFEILLPAETEADTEEIVKAITALGDLQFRVEVLPSEQYLARLTDSAMPPRLEANDPPWPGTSAEFDAFKREEIDRWRLAEETAIAYPPPDARFYVVPRRDTAGETPAEFHVLEQPAEERYRFNGRCIDDIAVMPGETGKPEVHYEVKADYQRVFNEWTRRNVRLPMAIILNGEYESAPTIQSPLRDRVRITLGDRKWSELEEEAKRLATVLKTGSLPVRPLKEAETRVGPKLAGEARQRGVVAVFVALALVLVFMVIYYRGTGLVANIALLLNLVLLLGVLAFFEAVLTLPGIAGLVLTLGMAVDANILINERIREERLAGRSIRRAVSEGYDRAFTTIVDANVTSLITAVFLYTFGSGAVKGFAITLGVGLVVSMFTAIFVTRTVLEWLMRRERFKEVHMLGSGRPPRIAWLGLRRYFAPISVVGVVFGIVTFAFEDPFTLYDVDFTGGYKLQARFEERVTVDEVRDALGGAPRRVTVVRIVDEDGNPVEERREVVAGPYPGSEVVAVGTDGREVQITVQRGLEQAADVPEEERLNRNEQQDAFEGYVRAVLGDRLLPLWLPEPPHAFEAGEDAEEALRAVDGGRTFRLVLLDPESVLTPEVLETALRDAMPYYVKRSGRLERREPSTVERVVVVRPAGEAVGDVRSFAVWMRSTLAGAEEVLERDPQEDGLQAFLGGSEFRRYLVEQGVSEAGAEAVALSKPFPSSAYRGPSEARRLKNDAIKALALSLLAIIVYIALRFRSRAMGISAVICLFHDVAITLGIVAVANLTGIVDAKINLPMVAAFLTLVGYSVNDTVVVFDRIRENRGKKPAITPAMIDLSINQTLARSIKTSVTFLLACLALFTLNIGQRNILEGFSFLLIVGAVIGTYSTIAISSPLLIFLPWLWERVAPYRPRTALVGTCGSRAYLLPLVPLAALLWAAWAVAFVGVAFAAGLVLFPWWAVTQPLEGRAQPAPAAA